MNANGGWFPPFYTYGQRQAASILPQHHHMLVRSRNYPQGVPRRFCPLRAVASVLRGWFC